MWCSTAWPTTRSNESSSKGRRSASATRPSTSKPRFLALRTATETMPGLMSVTARPSGAITPPETRLSEKKPVPQPSSSAVA